jgi:serine/threonine protein kinase
MLKTRDQNRRRGTQENWVKQNQNRKQLSDIYSFGVVMYEILFRSLPYPEGTDAIGNFTPQGKLGLGQKHICY